MNPPERKSGVPAEEAALHCRNCLAQLTGHYCVNCGQAADVHVSSTVELVHEVVEGITHSDSRLWRTLHLLWFKPGSLTLEYIAGRRVAYLPPFRLYLVLSVIFFLAASLAHVKEHVVRLDDGNPGETPVDTCRKLPFDVLHTHLWEDRLQHGCEVTVRDGGESLLHLAIGTMPKAMFVFLPLIAFFHSFLYWRPRHLYAEHLLFFLHLHAYFFTAMTLIAVSGALDARWAGINNVTSALNLVLLWSLPLYTIAAMRRVFGGGWIPTCLKAAALGTGYLAVLGLTLGAVFVYAMLQL